MDVHEHSSDAICYIVDSWHVTTYFHQLPSHPGSQHVDGNKNNNKSLKKAVFNVQSGLTHSIANKLNFKYDSDEREYPKSQ